MAWVAPVVGAAASVIGDLMSQGGQQSTNAMNMAMMQESQQWQEHMSDTQMQRRVADLKAAGLNPMLAVGGPGASMGSPVMPSIQNPNAAYGQLGGQISNAMQLSTMQSQINQNQASAQQLAASANEANARASKLAGVDTDYTKQQTAESQTHQELMRAQGDAAFASAQLDRAQVDVAHATLPKIAAEINRLGAAANMDDATAILRGLESSMQDLNINQFKLIAPQLVTQAVNAAQRSSVDLETAAANYQRARAQGQVYEGGGGNTIAYLDTIFNWFHLGANISSSSSSVGYQK